MKLPFSGFHTQVFLHYESKDAHRCGLQRDIVFCPERVVQTRYVNINGGNMNTATSAIVAQGQVLSEQEMREISAGGFLDKILSGLIGVTIGAVYEMGKQEGRAARMTTAFFLKPL